MKKVSSFYGTRKCIAELNKKPLNVVVSWLRLLLIFGRFV